MTLCFPLSKTIFDRQIMKKLIILGLDQENKLLAKGGNYMELSIQIKKYRTELHLSQEELAEKVYVTRQTISNWENVKELS
mgnify:CR=1 FL=1